MALELLEHASFQGPALPEPFVRDQLEEALAKAKLLPKTTGAEGKQLGESWAAYRRKLRELMVRGGSQRVLCHVLEPLVERLGYGSMAEADPVPTRENDKGEPGGWLLTRPDGVRLRVWAVSLDDDLDAPNRRGRAYRYSPTRIAHRVLLASGERVGLLTNGVELRILLSDPARPDSHISIPVDPHWKRSRDVPDTYRLLLALASPGGVKAVPELIDQARLQQTRVTRELRTQARQAIERFVQCVLDHPDNQAALAEREDKQQLARQLWHEGLVTVYRLLFILKLEASDDPARQFSFASTSLWRNSFSPTLVLARHARQLLDEGAQTGRLLEDGLRGLYRMFERGLQCTELNVRPLGGALFGEGATPILASLVWGEAAVAHLLDQLLWTPIRRRRAVAGRERVHYGPLDVEDLGRVYEALLELEPGIATEPMCRLRRQKLEVVVPEAQGEKYRVQVPEGPGQEKEDGETDDDEAEEEEDAATRGKKTKVEWIEAVPPGRFYLRVGLGRKASGSYYTPHSFVRFLIQETLGPQCDQRSPQDDPQPAEILKLKVLDPAMGSGHFLVEACRYLGDRLYEACRLCDEKATLARENADEASEAEWLARVVELPDPDDALVSYLPSRSPEGEELGVSQRQAQALCRRLVAVHCLYGVDRNPLAVELAKLALWIEAHAEGLPLTFLDHRLVIGDSLTGPFFEHLGRYPGTNQAVDDLFREDLDRWLTEALRRALVRVDELQMTVGLDLDDLRKKDQHKRDLDDILLPFRVLAAAWSGAVMLGSADKEDYAGLLEIVARTGELPERLSEALRAVVARGLGLDDVPEERAALVERLMAGALVPALPFDLAFPEVFYARRSVYPRLGFDAVVGNPPWDAVQFKSKECLAAFDFEILDAPTKREAQTIEHRLLSEPGIAALYSRCSESFEQEKRSNDSLYRHQKVRVQGDLAGRQLDAFRVFMERNVQLLCATGRVGVLVPSAFHANEGATGVRQLYLERMRLHCCYSFENRRKLFEIDSRFKFAVVVAGGAGPTEEFECAFYLHDDDWLFEPDQRRPALRYTLDFVKRTAGAYLSLLELRSALDAEVARECFGRGVRFSQSCAQAGIRFGSEFHMANDSRRFTPSSDVLVSGEDPRDPMVASRMLAEGWLALHEGKTFRQYDDCWGSRPRYLVSLTALSDREAVKHRTAFYRLALRDIAGPGDQNVAIAQLLPPGVTAGHTAKIEMEPQSSPRSQALRVLALLNSFTFDWLLQLRVRSHVNQFMLDETPAVPEHATALLVHTALRLTCNHAGYAALWREQVGHHWVEEPSAFTWPVLAGDDARWAVRSAVDAVVADAYGLTRDQYAHVLSTFSHKSYPRAPELCLARFDELKADGLVAFCRRWDPYHDIPLNASLPEPVIELPQSKEPAPQVVVQPTLIGLDEADPGEPPQEMPALAGRDLHVAMVAYIIDRHPSQDRPKRTYIEKATDLLHRHLDLPLGRHPSRMAAGPWDGMALESAEYKALLERAWTFAQVHLGGRDYHYLYGPDRDTPTWARRFGAALGARSREAARILALIAEKPLRDVELLATLYAAWDQHLAAGERSEDADLVSDLYAWNKKKRKFSRDEALRMLEWMRAQNIVPHGSAVPLDWPQGKNKMPDAEIGE